ncbi:hypothetical protein BGW38_005724 [Lunasporangiospora selenospora]|uniref:Cyclin n=1 Tax=Lunasporangiospora selenospora TaxID=979761 RepID=A0A9P6KBC3_9FUNG|nr:hypothetical protein BGW38_005724 [Lunasporangiospora selenospora]
MHRRLTPYPLSHVPPTYDIIDTAAVVIESIWPPPPPGSTEYIQRQKGLPLRTFIQETLKRSRSSYSTLQTALFYLYKIRNKVPCTYLKRRQDQLCNSQSSFAGAQPAAYAAGLVTPPASPHHFQSVPDFASNPSQDYFSSRYSTEHRPVAPSPLSSTCSMTSASPASISGYSPTSTASPASSTSSPSQSSSTSPKSTTSPKSASSASNSSSGSTTSHAPNQSNRIIYCGRRTFLAALMVASKYLQDRNYSNKAWAKISGLSIKEINANELIFLKLIDYSLFVSHETFMRWTALLVAHGQEATRRFLQVTDASSTSSTFVARAMSTPALVLNSSHIRYAHAVKSMESLTGLMSVPTTAAPALSTSTNNSTLTAVLSSTTITGITGKDLGYTGFAGSGVGGVMSAMVMTPVSPPSSEPDEDQRLVLKGGSATEGPRQAKIARTNSYPPLSQSKRTGSSLVC